MVALVDVSVTEHLQVAWLVPLVIPLIENAEVALVVLVGDTVPDPFCVGTVQV